MAEAASLVLGAVSVVALVGAFKDCIDLFSYIAASRSLGRDFELLDTKLDVEKTLLLQWAETVRLLDRHEYDKRLDHPIIGGTVSRILAGIHLLLSESYDLQHKYGMRRAEKNDTLDVQPIMSRNRMDRLNRKLEDLSLRAKDHQREATLLGKIRWVAHDKNKFDALIRDLSYFISKLNNILPGHEGCVASMTKEDLRSHSGLKMLRMIHEASTGLEDKVASLADQAITKICEDRILQRLWFRKIDDRRDHVKNAHIKTLHWALSPPHNDVEWSSLAHWLRSGSGIYWISGKAGSGKSTVMKYLWNHHQTTALLHKWASDRPLTLASFFFWGLGTTEQKSLDGLWRGLLFHILKSNPLLIPELLPKMWRETRSSDNKPELPSPAEMKEAFQSLGNGNAATHYFCIFIDGLDEYSGNYLDSIAFVSSLATNPNVKVLVSSRPIPTCVQAFSSKPRLQLQDLTRDDIKAYVDDELGSKTYMNMLRYSDPAGANKVLNDLGNKSSGVFLWVVLACRSVLEGFAAFDSVLELQRRVDELPPELEDLFRHMLNRIERRYHEQAAKFLRICYECQRKGDSRRVLPTVGLAIVSDYSLNISQIPEIRELSKSELKVKCQVLEGRLRSRCGGILEIEPGKIPQQDPQGYLSDWSSDSRCFCNSDLHDGHDKLIDSTVEFIHRSMFEFLTNPEVWDISCLEIADPMFEPNAMLAYLHLHLGEICFWNGSWLASGINQLELSLLCALDADKSLPASLSHYVSHLEAFLLNYWPSATEVTGHLHHQPSTATTYSEIALLLAIEAGLVAFLAAQLRSRAWTLTSTQKKYLLSHAVGQPILRMGGILLRKELSLEMIRYLLSQGCDPNGTNTTCCASVQFSNPWLHWLDDMEVLGSGYSIMDTAKNFIEGGAHIDAAESKFDRPLETLLRQEAIRFGDFDDPKVQRIIEDVDQLIESRRDLSGFSPSVSSQFADSNRPLEKANLGTKRSHTLEPESAIQPSKRPKDNRFDGS